LGARGRKGLGAGAGGRREKWESLGGYRGRRNVREEAGWRCVGR
jgi:hypothetical protein